jgi:Mrp family chromosome partitioning ATPase
MDIDHMNSEMKNNAPKYSRDVAVFCGGLLANRGSESRSIAYMNEAKALARKELDSRRLIHRDAGARKSADAFREIRTRLLELGGNRNFVTLVVSVSPGSGGSFVARNLAAAFAFDDAKTALLIDCNLRYPVQHSALGVEAGNGGLIDYLEQPTQNVQDIMYRTGLPRVRLIPAGHERESSAEYFSSYRMRILIDSLRSRYPDRYLFLDGPALKGSPEARILSELADFVVIVAGYGRDTAASVNQTVASLDPKKVAGVVFNYPP